MVPLVQGRYGPLGQASLGRAHMVLGAALLEASRRDLVGRNVARLAHLPPTAPSSTPRRSLTAEEATRLISSLDSHPHAGMVLTALIIGLRPGETFGLTWAAVDLEA